MKAVIRFFTYLLVLPWSLGMRILYRLNLYRPTKSPFPFAQNPSIAEPDGKPRKANPRYLPWVILHSNQNEWRANAMEYINQYFSKFLHAAKEPILYNDYQGQEIYRLSEFGALTAETIITVARKGEIITMKSSFWSRERIENAENGISYIESTHQQPLSMAEWDHLQILLKQCDYWNLPPFIRDLKGLDGVFWVLEGHSTDGYWIVNRWSPEDAFSEVGKYLFQLANISMEDGAAGP